MSTWYSSIKEPTPILRIKVMIKVTRSFEFFKSTYAKYKVSIMFGSKVATKDFLPQSYRSTHKKLDAQNSITPMWPFIHTFFIDVSSMSVNAAPGGATAATGETTAAEYNMTLHIYLPHGREFYVCERRSRGRHCCHHRGDDCCCRYEVQNVVCLYQTSRTGTGYLLKLYI